MIEPVALLSRDVVDVRLLLQHAWPAASMHVLMRVAGGRDDEPQAGWPIIRASAGQ
jgi:hypothetical protein